MIAPFSQFHVCSITVELIGGKTCRGHEITLYLQVMIEDGVVVNNKSHDEKRCYHCIKNYLPRSNLEYKIQRWIFLSKKKRSRRQNLNDTISLHFVTTMWILLRKISLFPSRLPPKPGSSQRFFNDNGWKTKKKRWRNVWQWGLTGCPWCHHWSNNL